MRRARASAHTRARGAEQLLDRCRDKPHIPILSVVLKDLNSIEEGEPEHVCGLVHVHKHVQVRARHGTVAHGRGGLTRRAAGVGHDQPLLDVAVAPV